MQSGNSFFALHDTLRKMSLKSPEKKLFLNSHVVQENEINTVQVEEKLKKLKLVNFFSFFSQFESRDDKKKVKIKRKWEKFNFALAPPDKCISF